MDECGGIISLNNVKVSVFCRINFSLSENLRI